MHSRILNDKDLAYNNIADEWSEFVDIYDTERRIEVLVNDFCKDKIKGKKVLDAGCGLGHFSIKIAQMKPVLHSAFDLAPDLVKMLENKLPSVDAKIADILNLEQMYPPRNFDLVISSEVIEHTPDPILAIKNLCNCVSDEGWLAISCPNVRWKWLLNLVQFIGIRKKYLGFENWISSRDITMAIQDSGLRVIRVEGIHLFPWQILPKKLLRGIDIFFRKYSFGLSINHAVLATRSSNYTK